MPTHTIIDDNNLKRPLERYNCIFSNDTHPRNGKPQQWYEIKVFRSYERDDFVAQVAVRSIAADTQYGLVETSTPERLIEYLNNFRPDFDWLQLMENSRQQLLQSCFS